MTDNTDNDVFHDDIRQAFHIWKNEDVITNIVFKYLRFKLDEATSSIQNNAFALIPSDLKMQNYQLLASKIQIITEILSLSLDDLEDMRKL
jgi:hypothetical protein